MTMFGTNVKKDAIENKTSGLAEPPLLRTPIAVREASRGVPS
jgi:hypothetical protein